MRMLSKAVVGVAAVATIVTMTAGTALADPPSGKTPAATAVVGVGSNTTESLIDQLAYNYDHAYPKKTQIYSWDATEPANDAIGDNIVTKSGCKAIPRPDGSSAGITTLASNIKDPTSTSHYCVDFGRSSRARASTDPAEGKGGVLFVALARDEVSYATLANDSNAPTDLSTKQLTEIYTCSVTNWDQVGGKNGTIRPLLPQAGSGTVSFFLAAIGVTTPGKCVSEPSTLEENEGVATTFKGAKNVIIPFSAGKWIAQEYHSAPCTTTDCVPATKCKTPTAGQNRFGCAVNGVLKVNNINKTDPLKTVTVSGKKVVELNPSFTPLFIRTLYDVVRYNTSTTNHIPAYLQPYFDASSARVPGYFCNSSRDTVLANYGFMTSALCGLGS